MKKNVMMRVASLLLVAVLASTCGISGTFAKYVTEASGSDTARVAKFGVELKVSDDSTFKTEYATDDTQNYSGTISVQSSSEDKLVAPGTDNEETKINFSISGTPEVAVKIQVSIGEDAKDVYLKKGTYTDFTKVTGYDADGNPAYGTFELAEDYYPVVFTLKQGDTQLFQGTIAGLQEYLNEYSDKAYYAPNTKLDAEFELSWAWAFEGNDQADTWLGNAAAGLIKDENAEYSINVSYELTVTVTQVD